MIEGSLSPTDLVRRYLLVCPCENQDEKAKEVFAHLFPDVPTPPVVKGKHKISLLAHDTQNEHIKAISRVKGKYAFYVALNQEGEVVEEYNLITIRRII